MKRKVNELINENTNNKKMKKMNTIVEENDIMYSLKKRLKKNKEHCRMDKDADIELSSEKERVSKKIAKCRNSSKEKGKLSVRFQESVDVNVEGSDKMEKEKLKEDVTDSTNTSEVISEMNLFVKGNKKPKTKKEKKLQKQKDDSKIVQQQCIEYLRKWENDRGNWKFEKAKQIRLISYMFDSTKLPDEIFPIFLEYIGGCKGNITRVIEQKCSVVVKEMEDFVSLNTVEQDEGTKPDEAKYERARNILQAVEGL